MANLSKPLNAISGEKSQFKWTEIEQESFDKLKDAICSSDCMLHLPKLDEKFYVICDGSSTGVGGVLMQMHNGKLKPVSFASRTCTKAESSLCTSQIEALAVTYCISKFYSYLQYAEVEIQTDHSALLELFKKAELTGKLQRWVMKISEINAFITHRKGKLNALADALSRNPLPENDAQDTEQSWREEFIPLYEDKETKVRFDLATITTPTHRCKTCSDQPPIEPEQPKSQNCQPKVETTPEIDQQLNFKVLEKPPSKKVRQLAQQTNAAGCIPKENKVPRARMKIKTVAKTNFCQ
jgi:hypothetical protein